MWRCSDDRHCSSAKLHMIQPGQQHLVSVTFKQTAKLFAADVDYTSPVSQGSECPTPAMDDTAGMILLG